MTIDATVSDTATSSSTHDAGRRLITAKTHHATINRANEAAYFLCVFAMVDSVILAVVLVARLFWMMRNPNEQTPLLDQAANTSGVIAVSSFTGSLGFLVMRNASRSLGQALGMDRFSENSDPNVDETNTDQRPALAHRS